MTKAATEMCVNMKTLKNWVKLSVHPHICSFCAKAFPYEAQLKRHVLVHNGSDSADGVKVKTDIRYRAKFKQEVVQYALEQSIQVAVIKYNLPHSTINFWVKQMSNPRSCHLCGKSFANDSGVRRHIEQVHKNTPEGLEEQSRRAEEIQISQPFSEFLADNNLLPTVEQMQERSREKERKKKAKELLALMAQETLYRQREAKENEAQIDQLVNQVLVKREDTDDPNLNMLAPITCLTVYSAEDQLSELSGTVKTEPNQGGLCHSGHTSHTQLM